MKKIFACVQIQNDADIIESLCRYYCSFCDGILVFDDNSSDNSLDILKSLINEGLPVFLADNIDSGLAWVNMRHQQFQLAIDKYNADVILPIDADEFLINVNGGSPRSILESLDENVEYHIMRRNFIYPREIENDTIFFPSAITKYTELLSPKTVMHRFLLKEKNAFPVQGCHSFYYTNNPPNVVILDTLCYNHYPIRDIYQFMLKIILGWASYLVLPYHDGDRRYGMAEHWKVFYEEIKKNGIISPEMLERYSMYSTTSIINNDTCQLLEETFDTSFCNDKLKLRYTKYNNEKESFLPILVTQLEKNLLKMPSWRATTERKVAGEQLGQANATIYNLNAYIETLKGKKATKKGIFSAVKSLYRKLKKIGG